MSATLELAQYDYYSFVYTYGSTSSMRIMVTSVTPEDVLITYVTLDNTIPYDTDYSYTATTGSSGHDGVITISKDDPNFGPCTSPDPLAATSCVVKIALYNANSHESASDVDYTIQLTTSRSSSVLQWEQPIRGSIQQGGYVPYSAYLGSSAAAAVASEKIDIHDEDNSGNIISLHDLKSISDTIRVTIAQLSGHVTAYLSCSTDRGGGSNRPNMTHHYWMLKADNGPTLDIPLIAVADRGCFGATPVRSNRGIAVNNTKVLDKSDRNGDSKEKEIDHQEDGGSRPYLPLEVPSGEYGEVATAVAGYLLISVYGDTSATYTLLLSLLTPNSSLTHATLLTPGVPSLGLVENKGFLYYTLRPGSSHENMR